MSVNLRRKHKALERALRKRFGSLPPHFKFKVQSSFQDTYDSIELPAGYTKPAQADLETEYDNEIADEETRSFTEIRGNTHIEEDLEVGTANLYVDVSTSRVGIGKTDPSTTLDIEDASTTGGLLSPRYYLRAIGDNSGNGTPDDNSGSPWYGLGHDNLAWNDQSHKYTGDIPILSGYSGVALRSGSGNIVLNTAGNVGVGTTNPSYKLHVSGDIYATGNVTGYSDRRAKEDIKKIENALEKIEKLNGYTYTMNDKRYTGLIAQEVLPVLPEAVTGSEHTNYALAYGNMMGLIVEAIKELKNKIDK